MSEILIILLPILLVFGLGLAALGRSDCLAAPRDDVRELSESQSKSEPHPFPTLSIMVIFRTLRALSYSFSKRFGS